MKRLAVIVPTFNHLEYAASAVASALDWSLPGTVALVVDDASPDWHRPSVGVTKHLNGLRAVYGKSRVQLERFDVNGGLTRSWNRGLQLAREQGYEYACCTNSDVLFSPGWDIPVYTALDAGLALAGPVTNAPGTEHAQWVGHLLPDYRPSDLLSELICVSELISGHRERHVEGTVNGFCMVARTATWWANAYDDAHVFRPRNDFTSRGERNPTPLMTLNEYELQRRWHAKGLRTGFCPGSFVFHYRSVSRGDAHRKGQWLRKSKVKR
jgi:glycosyltransferase involved in cell wall biosynthesis